MGSIDLTHNNACMVDFIIVVEIEMVGIKRLCVCVCVCVIV